MKSLVTWY